MQQSIKQGRPRSIVVGDRDHALVSRLANAALERMPGAADELLSEMERARVARQDRLPADVVRMGSTVTIEDGDGETRLVTLVYPHEADISEGRMSVLTPLGTALIGMAEGQPVRWSARDGRLLSARILAVSQPEAEAVGPTGGK